MHTLFKLSLTMALAYTMATAQNTATEIRGKLLSSSGTPITLSPVGGYFMKKGNGELVGKKGLQKYYDEDLCNGQDVQTAVHGVLQSHTESMLLRERNRLDAKEVLAMVMDSKTGELLTMASSNRYDPLHIKQEDIPSLNPKFTEYPYEPGSVMLPLTAAIALEEGKVTSGTWVNIGNGVLALGQGRTISDDMDHNISEDVALSLEDVILTASSVGISKIAWRLTGEAFQKGLKNFGLGEPTGIDLPRDIEGVLKSSSRLEEKFYRANTAYGYGLMVTPLQLLKAYNIFTSGGMRVQPHIATEQEANAHKVLSEKTTKQIKQLLIANVEKGTGRNASVQGLSIGGKTGTAHIAKNGKYTRHYNSSFFGFIEDEAGHSYTIGVLVIDPKAKGKYFASKSAVPVFREVVEEMLAQKLLIPNETKVDVEKVQQTQEVLHRMSDRLNITKEKREVATYKGKKTISPLKDARVEKAFGMYEDSVYKIKVFNESVTLQAPTKHSKVQAVFDGKVVFAGKSSIVGKVIVLAHSNKLHTVYAGLQALAPSVKVGAKVKKGDIIAKVDEKLLFQVTQDGKFVNPLEVVEVTDVH